MLAEDLGTEVEEETIADLHHIRSAGKHLLRLINERRRHRRGRLAGGPMAHFPPQIRGK